MPRAATAAVCACRALEENALPLIPDFGPRYLADFLWALAYTDHPVSTQVLQVACDVAWAKWGRLEAEVEQLAKIAWALIRLRADLALPDHGIFPAMKRKMEEATGQGQHEQQQQE